MTNIQTFEASTPSILVCDTLRSPIGTFGGTLSSITAPYLAALTIKSLISRHPYLDPAAIKSMVLGSAIQAGESGGSFARSTALMAGLPTSLLAAAVNSGQTSGMTAFFSAANAINAQQSDLAIVAGVDLMSRAPYAMPKQNSKFIRDLALLDTSDAVRFAHDSLSETFGDFSAVKLAERAAIDGELTRADNDGFVKQAHKQAIEAQDMGQPGLEITPITIPQRKGAPAVLITDEQPRRDLSDAKLKKMDALGDPDAGLTTAAVLDANDGAAAMLVATAEQQAALGLPKLAQVVAMGQSAQQPGKGMDAMVALIADVLAAANLSLDDMSILEIAENSSSEAIMLRRALGLGLEEPRLNALGSTLALGAPHGMTDVRMIGSAALQLRNGEGQHALIASSNAYGQAFVVILAK